MPVKVFRENNPLPCGQMPCHALPHLTPPGRFNTLLAHQPVRFAGQPVCQSPRSTGLHRRRVLRSHYRPKLKPLLGLAAPKIHWLLFWVLVSTLYMIGTDALMDWRGPWNWEPWRQAPLLNSSLRVLAVVICGPMAEEFIFRGMVQGRLAQYLPVAGAILIAAVVWAFIHVHYSLGVRVMFVGFGLLLGWARQQTGSIWTPIAMHIAWNAYAIW